MSTLARLRLDIDTSSGATLVVPRLLLEPLADGFAAATRADAVMDLLAALRGHLENLGVADEPGRFGAGDLAALATRDDAPHTFVPLAAAEHDEAADETRLAFRLAWYELPIALRRHCLACWEGAAEAAYDQLQLMEPAWLADILGVEDEPRAAPAGRGGRGPHLRLVPAGPIP